jgi:hypothetical protein
MKFFFWGGGEGGMDGAETVPPQVSQNNLRPHCCGSCYCGVLTRFMKFACSQISSGKRQRIQKKLVLYFVDVTQQNKTTLENYKKINFGNKNVTLISNSSTSVRKGIA